MLEAALGPEHQKARALRAPSMGTCSPKHGHMHAAPRAMGRRMRSGALARGGACMEPRAHGGAPARRGACVQAGSRACKGACMVTCVEGRRIGRAGADGGTHGPNARPPLRLPAHLNAAPASRPPPLRARWRPRFARWAASRCSAATQQMQRARTGVRCRCAPGRARRRPRERARASHARVAPAAAPCAKFWCLPACLPAQITQAVQGSNHPDASAVLGQLVSLLRGANKAAHALPLAQRCLAIKRQVRRRGSRLAAAPAPLGLVH